jgi:hypothetical protein
MVCLNSDTQHSVDQCRSQKEAPLAAYKVLASAARAKAGAGHYGSERFPSVDCCVEPVV